VSIARARFELCDAKGGGVYFRVKTWNGRVICQSKSYSNERKARGAIDIIVELGGEIVGTLGPGVVKDVLVNWSPLILDLRKKRGRK
jgi:uncharacterized protein YegP (UPF0339 family)